MDIEWEDPPPPTTRSGRGRVVRFVAQLKEQPGKWARYPTVYATGTSVSRYMREFPGTEWTARRQDDGRHVMWARYVGEDI